MRVETAVVDWEEPTAVAIALVLSSLYPAVTIALARAYRNQRLQGPQQVGVAIALAGAGAIAAA